MDIYVVSLTVLYNMAVFSVGQLPVIMLFFLKKDFLVDSYGKQTIIRMLPASVFLMIIPVYNIVSIVMQRWSGTINYNNNLSLLFSIGIVIIIVINIFGIIERIVTGIKIGHRKVVLNVVFLLIILLAIFALFMMIVKSQQQNINYLDYSVNILYPILLSTMSLISIAGLVFFGRLDSLQRRILIVFLFFIPLVFVDIFLLPEVFVQLVSLPFCLYIIMVFMDALLSIRKSKTEHVNYAEIADKYELTAREKEVFELVAQGLSNKEISDKLFVSVNTIKSHMQRIYNKLNISTRYQLISITKDMDKET